jgi:hypothetical protein
MCDHFGLAPLRPLATRPPITMMKTAQEIRATEIINVRGMTEALMKLSIAINHAPHCRSSKLSEQPASEEIVRVLSVNYARHQASALRDLSSPR